MTTTALEVASSLIESVQMTGHRTLRAYAMEAKYEFLRMLRAPSFGAIFLLLPVLLYLLFGVVIFGGALRNDPKAAIGVFTGFSVFGVMGPAMFGYGVTIAIEREQGLLRLKRALPMPPAAYLMAKMLMAVLFAALIMIAMCIAASTLGHVRMTPLQFLAMSLINVAGVLPFCAIGLFIGSIAKAAAAPGFTNLVYLPMMYLSGLFFPLPKFLQTVAPIWPSYHLEALALTALGVGSTSSTLSHLAVLVLVTVVFTALALRRLVKE